MKLITVAFFATLWVLGMAGASGGASPPKLPLSLPESQWRPPEQAGDRRFQGELERALKRQKLWQSLMSEGKMAVGLVDLSSPQKPRYAQVNGDIMMNAASLPKIAALYAAFRGFEDGTLKETPEVRRDLVEMIRRSSNPAASRMIEKIGLPRLERLILDPRYQFYDRKKGGGLWVGGGYPPTLENPDPLQGLLHGATVNQVCRFYYLLAHGRLISPERSRQMLVILSFPDLHDKFVKVLEKEVPPQRLYRKSGENRLWYSDSILVWGDDAWRRYILVALIEHEQGEKILGDLVPVVETLLRTNQPLRTGRGAAVLPAKR